MAQEAENPTPLRILHLEDNDVDHEIMCAHLGRGGLQVEIEQAHTEEDYLRALAQEPSWDVILSDYHLSGFSGLVALDLLLASGKDIPFIVVSGEIGEETAVETMRLGASDYLLKGKLARLVPGIEHAVRSCRQRRALKAADLALDESQQQLRELAQHLNQRIEHERLMLAREIHDDIGGALTALRFDLSWLSRHGATEEVKQRLHSAEETLGQAVDAVRRLMQNLRPPVLEQGLVAAIQWLASRFEKRTGVVCKVQVLQDNLTLPPEVPLVAYRFAQEALTNVSKHAQATEVQMGVSLAGGVLSLEIADNGVGLSQGALGKSQSFGLRGLRERAMAVGGWVEVNSGPRGTVLMLSVPVEAFDFCRKSGQAQDRELPFWADA